MMPPMSQSPNQNLFQTTKQSLAVSKMEESASFKNSAVKLNADHRAAIAESEALKRFENQSQINSVLMAVQKGPRSIKINPVVQQPLVGNKQTISLNVGRPLKKLLVTQNNMVLIRKESQNSKKSIYSLEHRSNFRSSSNEQSDKASLPRVQPFEAGDQYKMEDGRQPIHGMVHNRMNLNSSINLKNKNMAFTHKDESNQKPRGGIAGSKSEDARKQEEDYQVAASNASMLFDNSLLCCLTQAKRSKPKVANRMLMAGAPIVKPVQPMSLNSKNIMENSYTQDQDNGLPSVAKRARSEQQKGHRMVNTLSSQKQLPGLGRLSSNDSGGDRQSANSQKQNSSKCLVQ